MFLTISFCSEFLVNIIQCYEATKSMTKNPTMIVIGIELVVRACVEAGDHSSIMRSVDAYDGMTK